MVISISKAIPSKANIEVTKIAESMTYLASQGSHSVIRNIGTKSFKKIHLKVFTNQAEI